jgi:hypothetical protein
VSRRSRGEGGSRGAVATRVSAACEGIYEVLRRLFRLVSLAAAKGRDVLPDSVYRRVIAICGALVIAFGLWFLWTAATAVMKG